MCSRLDTHELRHELRQSYGPGTLSSEIAHPLARGRSDLWRLQTCFPTVPAFLKSYTHITSTPPTWSTSVAAAPPPGNDADAGGGKGRASGGLDVGVDAKVSSEGGRFSVT